MKKTAFILISLGVAAATQPATAADLLQVYQQALHSDPTFQKAAAQHRADLEGIPIARAGLLPSAEIDGTGVQGRSTISGNGNANTGKQGSRSLDWDLKLTQNIFNMSVFDTYSQSKIDAKAADATYSAALQNLMERVSTAYFNVLKAKEDVRNSYANMESLGRQLEQTQQQYSVGLKTMTDVDLAQSSYDNAVSTHISDINSLSTMRETLRSITGHFYKNLNDLKDDLPLITPYPANPDKWADVAVKQNWTVVANKYMAESAKKDVDIAWDANLPTLNMQVDYDKQHSNTYWRSTTPAGLSNSSRKGSYGPTATLNLTIPIVAGGGTVAQTNQNRDKYQVALHAYDFERRDAVEKTRQDYLTVLSDISKIKADRQAVKSGESSLQGNLAGYKVGTKTMVEVLKAQDTLFQAQTQYAEDRFDYITTSVQLKEETGTLTINDLRAINKWLTKTDISNHNIYSMTPEIKPLKVVRPIEKPKMPISHDASKAPMPKAPAAKDNSSPKDNVVLPPHTETGDKTNTSV